MKPPKPYRIRFELVSLAQMFSSLPTARRFPLRCWRVTFIVGSDGSNGPVLDGQRFMDVLDPNTAGDKGPVTFTVGGVFLPDGSPAVVDQTLIANMSGAIRQCPVMLVLEYLEPWHE